MKINTLKQLETLEQSIWLCSSFALKIANAD
jgi:hypothetical protein